ncbi:hypothetical protein Bca101_040423 [Brassica carinata]
MLVGYDDVRKHRPVLFPISSWLRAIFRSMRTYGGGNCLLAPFFSLALCGEETNVRGCQRLSNFVRILVKKIQDLGAVISSFRVVASREVVAEKEIMNQTLLIPVTARFWSWKIMHQSSGWSLRTSSLIEPKTLRLLFTLTRSFCDAEARVETLTTSMLLLFLSLRLVMVMNQGLETHRRAWNRAESLKPRAGGTEGGTKPNLCVVSRHLVSHDKGGSFLMEPCLIGRNRAESPRCTTISLSVAVEWSSTALRKQRRPRPFTNSPEIRSCPNLVGSGIDPRPPLLPLSELYLDEKPCPSTEHDETALLDLSFRRTQGCRRDHRMDFPGSPF